MDPTQTHPALPSGHPFTNVESVGFFPYWSATTNVENALLAWVVFFGIGNVSDVVFTVNDGKIWCVRGGQGVDPQ